MIDPRITPARTDLAAAHLRGVVPAPHYAEAETLRVAVPVLNMTDAADGSGPLSTQLLHGEVVDLYDSDPATGCAWVQNRADGYVGYVARAGLDAWAAPTHQVRLRSAQTYAEPRLKLAPLATLPGGALVCMTGAQDGFTRLDSGAWIPQQALEPVGTAVPDFVDAALGFLGAPYLWGGRSGFGLDCSALVQLALAAAGIAAPRDSDMQQSLGKTVDRPLARGDLVFWRGHVGIMCDAEHMVHANAHHMAVAVEPLAQAEARIADTDTGPVTAIRRL